MTLRYGYPIDRWELAKDEMRTILVGVAKQQATIAYSEVTRDVDTIKFEPDSYAFHAMLGEISTEEADAGRGMLSAVVVHRDGETMPGPGFFTLAQKLHRDTSDKIMSWVAELNTAYDYWHHPKV